MPMEARTSSAMIFACNTPVAISAQCEPNLISSAVLLCYELENALSRTVADGDVARINRSGGRPVEVSGESAEVIAAALHYCELSGGRFDITMGAVVRLWDFSAGRVPLPESIEEGLRHVDYRKVHVHDCTVTLEDPEAIIDLGGIAKGHIADRVARHLAAGGAASGIVNLGGNVVVIGTQPDGSAWRVGIRSPNGARGPLTGVASVKDCSVVTSGLYERGFMFNGMHYHHILDPETGYPAQTDVRSATIVSATSLQGDGLSTLPFLMGAQRSLDLFESLDGVEAVLIDADDRLTCTSGIGSAVPFAPER